MYYNPCLTDAEGKLRNQPPSVDEIDERVCITNYKGAQERKLLRNARVTHIICCMLKFSRPFPKDFTYLHLRMDDDSSQIIPFERALGWISSVLESDLRAKVCVHCFAGSSRSGAMVVAWLMYRHKLSYEDAIARAKKCRPLINPNPGFCRQLRKLEASLNNSTFQPEVWEFPSANSNCCLIS